MKRNVFPTLAAAALSMAAGAALPSSAEAATVVTSNGDVSGVTGVLYNGMLYDGSFVQDSIEGAFPHVGPNRNTSPIALTFSTLTDARGISNALATGVDLSSYLRDGDTFGGASPRYQNVAAFSMGKRSNVTADLIDLITPYSIVDSDAASVVLTARASDDVRNENALPYRASIGLTDTDPSVFPDTGAYVIWTAEASDVPEPASLALLGTAAVAAAAVRRRRK